MKRFVICLLMLAFSRAGAGELSVSIENPPAEGSVEFVLFDSANAFGDNRDAVTSVRYEVSSSGVYRIKDVPPGEYALLVYYDENDNRLMDLNFIGIPKEPLAYANGYRPKGPPSFKKASFIVGADGALHFDVFLERPLGEFGRIGVGCGVIVRSSPYRDYDGDVYQIIPAVTYMGERLQIYGPEMQLGLLGSDRLRLGGTGRYRMAAYDVDESPFLAGMEAPEGRFMMGLELIADMPGGVALSSGYSQDILGSGGGMAGLKIDKTFQIGNMRVSPRVGISGLSAKIANDDFGVPDDSSSLERPAYELDAAVSMEVGMQMFIEFKRGWLVMVNAGVEFFDDEVADSPIVSEDYVVGGFGLVSYVF